MQDKGLEAHPKTSTVHSQPAAPTQHSTEQHSLLLLWSHTAICCSHCKRSDVRSSSQAGNVALVPLAALWRECRMEGITEPVKLEKTSKITHHAH